MDPNNQHQHQISPRLNQLISLFDICMTFCSLEGFKTYVKTIFLKCFESRSKEIVNGHCVEASGFYIKIRVLKKKIQK